MPRIKNGLLLLIKMENFTYQRMKKFVEQLLKRKLTEDEYKRFKKEMDRYIFKKQMSKEWIYNIEETLERFRLRTRNGGKQNGI